MIRVILLLALCACEAVPQIDYIEGGDNTCPNAVPSYADTCCGTNPSVPCKGTNCPAACSECAATCAATDLCCPTAQGHAVCRQNLQCQP